ncbi:MAG TPA: sulfite exporter TauE/SafE family protein, partial [Micromonosporaceae bacterium]
ALVGHPHTMSSRRRGLLLHAMVGFGAVYGGYFGAALGVMLVAALGLVLDESLAHVGALKNAISAVVGLVTVAAFALFGPVNWASVAVLAPATLFGGYLGARWARRLPPRVLRAVIVVAGVVVGIVLLLRAV